MAHMLLLDPQLRVRHAAAATIATLLEGPTQRAYLAVAEAREMERLHVRCSAVLRAIHSKQHRPLRKLLLPRPIAWASCLASLTLLMPYAGASSPYRPAWARCWWRFTRHFCTASGMSTTL